MKLVKALRLGLKNLCQSQKRKKPCNYTRAFKDEFLVAHGILREDSGYVLIK